MFEGPEYASYIELCRALRLERDPLEVGDWYWDAWSKTPQCRVSFAKLRAHPEHPWIPRLDQWLDLIPLARTERFIIKPVGMGTWQVYREVADDVGGWSPIDDDLFASTGSPTREEACARLYQAFTSPPAAGPTVPGSPSSSPPAP